MSEKKTKKRPEGGSKIHGIAMYDSTWRKFKEFKDYYDLSGDVALNALIDNWNAINMNPEVKKYIEYNKRHSQTTLTEEQRIKKAKMMSSHKSLVDHGLILDLPKEDDGSRNIFKEDQPINFDKFI